MFKTALHGEPIADIAKPLPCPACGRREPEIFLQIKMPAGYAGVCSSCGAEGPVGESAIEAAEAWNRRAK